MRVLLLSRYGRLGASSRVRSFQYLPFLELKGWQVDVRPLFSDNYVRSLYNGKSRGLEVLAGYCRRLKDLVHAGQYDLIWIEKEAFPFMPALAEWLLAKVGVPYVVDYDDALFHRYDSHRRWLIRSILGRKIGSVMRYAALVIAGNEYLAEYARAVGAKCVEIVPTVVDLTRYEIVHSDSNHPLVVGWIGSPSTSHYLAVIAPVIESLSKEFDVRFVAVGASEESVCDLPMEAKPWSEETEIQSIRGFDIGIMPLVDDPWERGKCGYKLIQYMACGVPVVASPVGVNKDIVEPGGNGYLAQDLHDWAQALRRLMSDKELRQRLGDNGRQQVEARYSLQVQAHRLEKLMRSVLR
ncbi:TPA: glycosyltransferase [Candidatus Poribacteria bacterium]|nr:glycosyltransferase [Candidatus Poribacteria bacterium]